MELYKNTADAFVKYLIKHGYPEESIIFEWGNKECAVDIVVVADDIKTPIAAFEIKGKKTKQTINYGITQMKKAADVLSLSVPMSLVFGTDHAPFFQVIDVSDIIHRNEDFDIEYLLNEKEKYEPISYKTINSSSVGKRILKKTEERKKRLDWLAKICWFIILPISVLLFFLDAFNVYSFSNERLFFLGVVIVVAVLPFYSEFSIKDFSVKRNNKDKK